MHVQYFAIYTFSTDIFVVFYFLIIVPRADLYKMFLKALKP